GGSRMQLDPAGHLSNRGYIYPGTGSGLQSGAYIYGTAAPATLIGVSGADGFRATVIRAYAAESGGYYGAFQLEAPGVSEYWQVTYASDNKRLSFREGTGWPPTELMYLKTGGHLNTYGYLYPGTGSGFQTSRYIRDDGDRLLAYGGFKIDVSSGDTPLVFQRAGSYKWSNYVNATYDDLRWAAYIGGSWYDRMVLDDGSGSLYIDGTYNTFSPVPPKENMSPEDYLAWAMEDASKPLKPYPGIPKEPGELEKYRKDVSKIAIGVARYVDHLRTQVAALDTRLTQAGL
ncbi:MAG: hypothetical protein Q8P59_03380, partial [Dehalococcoidia bacterium]|nr:hypothetical protein [Dehalococcoidia bacterium]